jgi:hypothetical protein
MAVWRRVALQQRPQGLLILSQVWFDQDMSSRLEDLVQALGPETSPWMDVYQVTGIRRREARSKPVKDLVCKQSVT